MSGTVGLPNNVRGNIIGGWVGINGGKAKLIGGWVGDSSNHPKQIYSTETSHGEKVFTASDTWEVPSGVTKIDIFCVGGAGGNCERSYCYAEHGSLVDSESGYGVDYELDGQEALTYGGSGYTHTESQVTVTPGETLVVSVGSVGSRGHGREYYNGTTQRTSQAATDGGASGVYRGSTALCTAAGGKKASTPNPASSSTPGSSETTVTKGGNGGSGGKSTGLYYWKYNYNTSAYVSPSWARRVNGANGSDGGNATASGVYENFYNGQSYSWTVASSSLATGQGTTTKAFGESGGTQYDNFGEDGTVIIRW